MTLLLVAYMLGSIPCGILVAKSLGIIDPRDGGSGNIGAANLARIGGKKAGIITFLLDFLKGLLPVAAALLFFEEQHPQLPAAVAVAAVFGHCYSVFLRFSGGKGVATTAGALLLVVPVPMLVGLVTWAITFATLRITSVAAMMALCALIYTLALIGAETHLIFAAAACGLMVIRRHIGNWNDLLENRERTF